LIRYLTATPPQTARRIFLNAAKDIPSDGDISGWLRTTLADGAGGRGWPKDEEFRDFLLRYRAYS
jgi:hypothetical protein